MTEQKRYNAGKPKMDYILSMPEAVSLRFLAGEDPLIGITDLHSALWAYARGEADAGAVVSAAIDNAGLSAADMCGPFQYGESKYQRGNYLLGARASQYIGCAARHFHAYASGEILDPESGCSHLAHVVWNVAFCAAAIAADPTRDDRLYLGAPGLGVSRE